MTGDQDERLRKLRHDISNPLAAMLAETQLLLLKADSLDKDTAGSLREIESLARRMREILQSRP